MDFILVALAVAVLLDALPENYLRVLALVAAAGALILLGVDISHVVIEAPAAFYLAYVLEIVVDRIKTPAVTAVTRRLPPASQPW